jgi:hypothetical protein
MSSFEGLRNEKESCGPDVFVDLVYQRKRLTGSGHLGHKA